MKRRENREGRATEMKESEGQNRKLGKIVCIYEKLGENAKKMERRRKRVVDIRERKENSRKLNKMKEREGQNRKLTKTLNRKKLDIRQKYKKGKNLYQRKELRQQNIRGDSVDVGEIVI